MSNLEPTQTTVNALLIHEKLIFIGLGDYRVEIYALNDFNHMKTITLESEIRDLVIHNNRLFIATLQEEILVVDLSSYKIIEKIPHVLGVTSLHTDGKYLYSTGFGDELYIHKIHDLKIFKKIKTNNGRINTIAAASDRFMVGDGFRENSCIMIFDKQVFKEVAKIDIEAKRVVKSLIHNEFVIIGTGGPPKIEIWNCNDHKPLGRKIGYQGDIRSIAASIRNVFVASSGKLYIYNTVNYEFEGCITEPLADINAIETSKDYLIYGSRNTLQIRDIRSFEKIKSIEF